MPVISTPSGNFVFSPSHKRFFPVARQTTLTAEGKWPSDAVAVTDVQFNAFNVPTTRHMLTMVNGQLSWVPKPQQPSPPLAQQASALLNGTIVVKSTSTPALNGTYSVNQRAQNRILGMSAGLGLSRGKNNVNWPDANGGAHQWTASQFEAFAKGVIQFMNSCKAVISGQSTTLPSTTIEIP